MAQTEGTGVKIWAFCRNVRTFLSLADQHPICLSWAAVSRPTALCSENPGGCSHQNTWFIFW